MFRWPKISFILFYPIISYILLETFLANCTEKNKLQINIFFGQNNWESWATFFILTLFAYPICPIILFPVVLRNINHECEFTFTVIINVML